MFNDFEKEGYPQSKSQLNEEKLPPQITHARLISTPGEVEIDLGTLNYRRIGFNPGEIDRTSKEIRRNIPYTRPAMTGKNEDEEVNGKSTTAQHNWWNGRIATLVARRPQGWRPVRLSRVQKRRLIGMGGLCAFFALSGFCVFSGHGANHYLATNNNTQLTDTPATTPVASTTAQANLTATPDDVVSAWASGTDDPNVAHARNTAYGFTEGLWTFDYRYPQEYVDRLNPFANPAVQNQIVMASKGEHAHQQQLIENGEVLSLSLTISSTHQTATAHVIVEVNVFRKSETVDVTTPTTAASQNQSINLRPGYQTYRAISEVDLNLAISKDRWLVTSYQVAQPK